MYERFTDLARKVMRLANQEAQRFNHEYIGTEHILLGLVKEGSGVAANVLKNLDIDLRKIRLEIEKMVQAGPDMVHQGKLPFTPRAKRSIEYAIEEARNLNHNYVGTEHLLLGLCREEDGVAGQVLMCLDVDLPALRKEVQKLLGSNVGPIGGDGLPKGRQVEKSSDQPGTPVELPEEVFDCLGAGQSQVGQSENDESERRLASLEGHLRKMWVALGALAGFVFGSAFFPDDGGALVGALLGAILGVCVGGPHPPRRSSPS
jgi:ATP-dependent Clp protease ATP-binding subunit ClpA